MSQIVIELGDHKNSSFHWAITGQELRGRFSVSNFKPATPDPETGIHAMPDIPGQCIELDETANRARIFDPLDDPKARQLLDAINETHKKIFRVKVKPVPEFVMEDLSDLQINTWKWWMWRFVSAKQPQARVLIGDLSEQPTGEVIHNFYDWGELSRKTKRVGSKPAPQKKAG